MALHKNINHQVNQWAHIQSLRGMAAGLFIICLFLAHGWLDAKKDMPLHIPPDLRTGARLKLNDPHPANVYSFALAITQMLHSWDHDGSREYGENIYRLAPYLTPQCAGQLQDDMDRRAATPIDGIGTKFDELQGRTRKLSPILSHAFNEKSVTVHGNGLWTVTLDLHLVESYKGMTVKEKNVRYPMRVILYDTDPQKNAYGLALDCFASPGPAELNLKAEPIPPAGQTGGANPP